jgi:hypothetical protein
LERPATGRCPSRVRSGRSRCCRSRHSAEPSGCLRFTIVISAGHPHPVPICGSSCGHPDPSARRHQRQRGRRWLTRCRQDMRCIHMRTERFERVHDHAADRAVEVGCLGLARVALHARAVTRQPLVGVSQVQIGWTTCPTLAHAEIRRSASVRSTHRMGRYSRARRGAGSFPRSPRSARWRTRSPSL